VIDLAMLPKSVKIISLYRNKVKNISALSQLRSLEEVDLSYLLKEDGTSRPIVDYAHLPMTIKVLVTPRSNISNSTSVRGFSNLRTLHMSYCHDAKTNKPLTVDLERLTRTFLETLYMSEHAIVNFDSIKKDFPRLRKLALSNSLEFGGARKKVDLDVIPHSLHELYIKGMHVRHFSSIRHFSDLSILYIDHIKKWDGGDYLIADSELSHLLKLRKLETLRVIGLHTDWNRGLAKQLANKLTTLIRR